MPSKGRSVTNPPIPRQQETAPDGPRCLYVIGMHRSGTSALTGLLSELGLHGPVDEYLIPASRWNERGNRESATLTRFNNHLLRSLGGSWAAPPVLTDGWDRDPGLDGARVDAQPLLTAAFSDHPFVWKDPRNCLLLPFWRSVISPPNAALFVYRDPLEVAGSIKARDSFTLTHGLALWERYVRSAAINLSGLPTFAVRFDRVLESGTAWRQELVSFLDEVGIPVDPAAVERAASTVDDSLRHQRSDSLGPTGLEESQHRVLRILDEVQGTHRPWSPPDLGEEPGWVEDVLTIRLAFEDLRRQRRRPNSLWDRARVRMQRTVPAPHPGR